MSNMDYEIKKGSFWNNMPNYIKAFAALVAAIASLIPVLYMVGIGSKEIFEVSILNVSSGKTYAMGKLAQGKSVYNDSSYHFDQIPQFLEGKTYIVTANRDKFESHSDFLKLLANQDVVIYVGYDDRWSNKPSWLDQFQDTNADLVFSAVGNDVQLSLYEKEFAAGEIILGGNFSSQNDGENYGMYSIVIVKK